VGEFFLILFLVTRDEYRDREDDDGFFMVVFWIPLVCSILFAYLLYCGLEDMGVGWLGRWSATLLVAVAVLAACLEDRWLIGLGTALAAGLVGAAMISVQAYRRDREEESDIDGPRYRFS
jgi:hypothetical protein